VQNCIDDLYQASVGCGLDPSLVSAIAFVETGYKRKLVRFEPKWNYFYQAEVFARNLGITVETEQMFQSVSWGPLQIMGTNCRRLGFNGFLQDLCGSTCYWATYYSCQKLKQLCIDYRDDDEDIISAWNQGTPVKIAGFYRNQEYVDKVVAKLKLLRNS
jgi:hypothetical protein